MRRLKVIGVLIAAGVLAAACGTSSSPSSSKSSGPSGALTIDNESGGTWTCDFNPFNLSYLPYSLGPVYEPLAFVNTLQSGKASPWLASSWTWGAGNKTLTFTIRKGVKFTNGNPLTAADVAYTFNLLKKYPVLDINAVWSVLSGVTQQGSDQVVMTFKTAAVQYFYYIADQVGIVDQSVWSKISNPSTYPDKNPVGTGGFTVSSKTCTPQNIKYTANTHYWQKGEPKVGTVNYPSFLTNDTANTYLANGSAQWGSQFIPSIKSFYTSKNPNYHYWFPPVANVSMFINLTNPLLKNVAVRQAMAYAIDRQKASTIGEYGYEPAANQPGLPRAELRQQPRLQPVQGHLDPAGGRVQAGLERHLPDGVRPAAVVHDPEQRRGLGLGGRGADHPDQPQGDRDRGHPGEPGRDDLPERSVLGQVPARLRQRDRRADPVLRAAAVARLGQLRADRDRGRLQLGALQQPGHRRADQLLRRDDVGGPAALDRGPTGEGHAAGRAGDPGHRVGGLVPVRHRQLHRLAHPGQPVRAAGRL